MSRINEVLKFRDIVSQLLSRYPGSGTVQQLAYDALLQERVQQGGNAESAGVGQCIQ
ncbi:hypothetical protein [Photorhabdus luminescens]|uniref:hypothetical protein n=1 Tax=Photorhabdus luminescens TaxID=29488 RepID=UPI002240E347|nr:hypothetical protein [Photorhabdus luminescens]MCW7762910.1 hypothetical protein [Photorhabdus luminescens subsp. venezuelensis]